MYRYSSEVSDHDFFVENGPLIPVVLTCPVPLVHFLRESGLPPFPTRSGYALIDTGAERSAVDGQTMLELSIPDVGEDFFLTTHGIQPLHLHNLSVNIPDVAITEYPLHRVAGGRVRNKSIAGLPIIMLLGRDILRQFVLTYDGPNATVTLSR